MKHFHAHTPQTTSRRRWTTSVAAVAGASLALLSSGLSAHEISPPPVPTVLEVPAGHRPFLLGHATGTQNYMCLPKGLDFAWAPVGPQATLFDNNGKQITTHFLSLNPEENPEEGGTPRPTWQHSRDTSTVWAKPVAPSSDADFVEPGAIPWLLLQVVGTDPEPTRGYRLTETTYMQRVHTSGGREPSTGCAQASDVSNRAWVSYTADYVFYKATERE